MTNLQAIDLLKGLEQSLDDYCELNDEGKTAFGMAITALELFGISEQFPSAQPETEERNGKSAQNVPKEDSVSRKAAIDAVNGVIADYIPTLYGRYEALPLEMAMALKRLPTAEPTLYGYKIEHLAYIARVMQKEGVTAEYAVRTFGDVSRASRMIIEELQEKVEKSLSAMQLPSAEPERKTGRWIPQDHNRRSGYVTTTVYYYPKCSECGHSGNYDMSYCPNCGARMEGDAE